ncbi:hypothetical protein CKO35_07930 [Ectothiorhodospira shaposhnikovii]|nr:hypothetical protein [Ectothiorhodospira shaposhnikovii]
MTHRYQRVQQCLSTEPTASQSVNYTVKCQSCCQLESAMGQKMKNAPVYFTIAQVRHNPVLRLGSYAPDIQDRMRKAGYPDFKKGVSMAFTLAHQLGDAQQPQAPVVEQVERLMFFSTDSTRGFIVEQNALSFHTTEYETFEALADEFTRGLAIVHECVTLAHSERIGLRYLDAVVPPAGEPGLTDYLASGVLGLSSRLPEDVRVSHSFAETHIQTADCTVLARTIIQSGPLGFPMDLQPIGVKIADRFREINGVHAIVDTDASIEGRHPFDLDNIKSQLFVLRKGIGVAFDATVTPLAVSAWNS